MDEEWREVGCAYLEIPVVFFDGRKGLFPYVPYVCASEESNGVHCGDEVASVSRIDDSDGVGKTHSCFTNARPRVEVEAGGGGCCWGVCGERSGGEWGGGD